ncbi:MAG: 3-deoxy-manno-octulosonate cytidylyltransferase [Proteobacteria bacterium]|nr:3-deoxy-manno-octulosonate cytidylyltransferase [Pseudomonadota bacterium]MDA1355230.1 3-deoxy-manno-octulosonate cytidylyltransferase [Pseudomonadota bacterium]
METSLIADEGGRRGRPANPIVLIPARLQSVRLPNKPLADIAGVPMIIHVMRRAQEANLGRVVVACAEREIADAVMAAGGEAVLTRADHASGSDRIFEALTHLDGDRKHDAVINLQGDLPTLAPDLLRAALDLLADAAVDIGTLAAEINDPAERDDPNVVKAVISTSKAPDGVAAGSGRALYFTRSRAPSGDGVLWHHIGLYAFRRAALEQFIALPPSPLEQRERLEQLRALEAGMRIDVAFVDTVPLGVDTPRDLARARELLGARAGS